jgi:trk system potassium uptake protein TrkA
MGFDRDVLLRAGIEEAGAFAAAVSSGDNSNIISARVARGDLRRGARSPGSTTPNAPRCTSGSAFRTVATVPWTTDRLLNVLTRETETTKWRDPSGNVGVAELALHGTGSATA